MKTKAQTKSSKTPLVVAPSILRTAPLNAERGMSVATVAALLEVSTKRLRQMVAAGEYPSADMTVGKRDRWSVARHNEGCRRLMKDARGLQEVQ